MKWPACHQPFQIRVRVKGCVIYKLSEPLRAAFKGQGSVYNGISPEQEAWAAKVGLVGLSKQPVI